VNSLKPFWNDLLDELFLGGNLWEEAGKPKFGHLFSMKSSWSLRYKNAIKQAVVEYEHKFDDALYDHFIRKETSEFWKCWSHKFCRNKMGNMPQQVIGATDNAAIAIKFAKHFSNV